MSRHSFPPVLIKYGFIHSVFQLFICAAAVALALAQLALPEPLSTDASPEIYSASRAWEHVKTLSNQPHPSNSPAQLQNQAYLVKTLSDLGLDVEVQATTSVYPGMFIPTSIQAGVVHNVIGRLSGKSGAYTLALMAHYDSVPTSPGATDDIASVAAILEVLRALLSETALENNLVVIFSDSEENGLLGALAFVKEHPWADEIDLAINIDTAGMHGPVVMNDSSQQNAWLVVQSLNALPDPRLYSMGLEFGRSLMGDRTDLAAFKQAGVPGMSFVTAIDPRNYHTMQDNAANLDLASLQHRGDTILALAKHFGNLALDSQARQDQIAFTIYPGIVLQYGTNLALPLLLLSTLMLGMVLMISLQRRIFQARQLAWSLLAAILIFVVTLALAQVSWMLLSGLTPSFQSYLTLMRGLVNNAERILIGLVCLIFGFSGLLYAWIKRRLGHYGLITGAMILWWLLALISTLALPMVSYSFVWPLLFGSAGLYLLILIKDKPQAGWWSLGVFALVSVPTIVIVTPGVYLVFWVLGFGALGMPGVILWGTMVALASCLLMPFALWGVKSNWLVGCLILAALFFLATAPYGAGFNQQRPLQNHILYLQDADRQDAFWIGGDSHLDHFTEQFFTADVKESQLAVAADLGVVIPSYREAAPFVPLPLPEAQIMRDALQDGARVLQIQVHSGRQAPNMVVNIFTSGVIQELSIDGKPVDLSLIDNPNTLTVNFHGLPDQGFVLDLSVSAGASVSLRLDDRSSELPDIPGLYINPRTPDMMPAAAVTIDNMDGSRVIRSYIFEAP